MAEAKFDNNRVATMLATLNTDGITPSLVKIDATTHAVKVHDGTTGSDLSGDIAKRDNNGQPVLLAVSDVDGVTPVPLYVNSDGQLLVDSN